jgi:hypothetical protein
VANTLTRNLKAFWEAWKGLARKIGNFQARVLLTLLYALVVLPFGLLARLFSDSLRIKHRPTKWLEHPAEVHDMSFAQKQ